MSASGLHTSRLGWGAALQRSRDLRIHRPALTADIAASINTTMGVYGHLMRGSEKEAVGLVDAYLERALH